MQQIFYVTASIAAIVLTLTIIYRLFFPATTKKEKRKRSIALKKAIILSMQNVVAKHFDNAFLQNLKTQNADLQGQNLNLKQTNTELRDSINTDTVQLLKDFTALQERNQEILADNDTLNTRLSECIRQNADYAKTIDTLNEPVKETLLNGYIKGITDILQSIYVNVYFDDEKKYKIAEAIGLANNLPQIEPVGGYHLTRQDLDQTPVIQFIPKQ